MVSRKGRQLSLVGSALDGAFARLGLSGRLAQHRAVAVWPELVGSQVAAATRALGVRDGVLFVATKSSTWAHELILRKRPILQSLNKALGGSIISDIRFMGRGLEDAPDLVQDSAGSRAREIPDPSLWRQVPLTDEDRESITLTLEPLSDPDLRLRVERVLADSLRLKRWKEEHGWPRCPRCGLPHDERSDLCGICRSGRAGS